ncbi:MAG: hypothetical protein L6R30_24630 [Thermoanaerobaculia bacterium]|nr:hypothetical protein [Thermoanaerobaculia bacterium]
MVFGLVVPIGGAVLLWNTGITGRLSRAASGLASENPAGLTDLVRQQLTTPADGSSLEGVTTANIHATVLVSVGAGSEPKLDTLRLVAAELGTGEFNGRRLPAALAVFEMEGTNQVEGKHTKGKFIVGAIQDKEFNMWRNIGSWPYEVPEALTAVERVDPSRGLPAWRSQVRFARDAASQEIVPPGLSASPGGATAIPTQQSEAVSTPVVPADEQSRDLTVLFNGLEPGSRPSADMTLTDETDVIEAGASIFSRNGDRMELFGVPLQSIRYGYFDGSMLWYVSYQADPANAPALLTEMKREFGEPDWVDKDGYPHWRQPKTDTKNPAITATFGADASGGGLAVMSGPISKRALERSMQKAKDQAEARPAFSAGSMVQTGHEHLDQKKGNTPDQGYPFVARFCCTVATNPTTGQQMNSPIPGCFLPGGGLRVKTSDKSLAYTFRDLIRDETHSLLFNLTQSFQIEAQCVSQGQHLILTVYDASGKAIYSQKASNGQWIKVQN